MVILYTIEGHQIYVGVDQFENEELILFSGKFMEQTDLKLIWYHVDSFSSPHAYIRLEGSETAPTARLAAIACQIVKDGSIEGTKRPQVDVVHTPASNLAKFKGAHAGQVSFKDQNLCGYERAVKKDTKILRALEKVKSEITMQDLEEELEDLRARKKGKGKAKPKKPDSDDDWGDDSGKKEPVKKQGSMFADQPKVEFNPNMEDDFM
jgi:hypothetical protein